MGGLRIFAPMLPDLWVTSSPTTLTTAGRLPCWRGNWDILCHRRRCLECGSGARADYSLDRFLVRYNPASTHTMRKAALLYNPDSGGSRRLQRELQSALAILRDGGVEAQLVPTHSPD